MLFDASELDRRETTQLMNGLIQPRPIAWVSTVSESGVRNLTPFSYFNAFSTAPPSVAIGPGSRGGEPKDSLTNIRRTREFVINFIPYSLALEANATSGDFDPDVDEWEVAGLESCPSDDVSPERVSSSPASLECRVFQLVDLGSPEVQTNTVIIARVTRIHVRDDCLNGPQPDPQRLDLVGRMGADDWCRTRDRFVLRRPGRSDPDEVKAELLRTAEADGA